MTAVLMPAPQSWGKVSKTRDRQMKEMEKAVQLNEPEEIYFPRNGEKKRGGKCRLQGKLGVWEQMKTGKCVREGN